jgi:hypothetical protein
MLSVRCTGYFAAYLDQCFSQCRHYPHVPVELEDRLVTQIEPSFVLGRLEPICRRPSFLSEACEAVNVSLGRGALGGGVEGK